MCGQRTGSHNHYTALIRAEVFVHYNDDDRRIGHSSRAGARARAAAAQRQVKMDEKHAQPKIVMLVITLFRIDSFIRHTQMKYVLDSTRFALRGLPWRNSPAVRAVNCDRARIVCASPFTG